MYLLTLFGDSLIANGNWALTAARALDNLDVRMEVDNQAVAGEKSVTSYAKAVTGVPAAAAAVLPYAQQRFCFWKYYTINDDTTGTTTAAMLQSVYENYVDQFIDLCHDNDMIPIIMTCPPTARTATGAIDDVRKSYNDQIRAKAASDVWVFDADALLTDGGSPARLMPAYSLDGTHFTGAGMTVLANQLGAMFRDYYLANH